MVRDFMIFLFIQFNCNIYSFTLTYTDRQKEESNRQTTGNQIGRQPDRERDKERNADRDKDGQQVETDRGGHNVVKERNA